MQYRMVVHSRLMVHPLEVGNLNNHPLAKITRYHFNFATNQCTVVDRK